VWKKEDVKSQGVAHNSPSSAGTSTASSGNNFSSTPELPSIPPAPSAAFISQGIRIKGEVSGSEDLFVDGHVEGKLNLSDTCCVTIGPNGVVKADILAREVIVRGRVDGKIVGREKIQLCSTGNISGDLQTERLTIEDGAILRGRVEIETGKPIEARGEAKSAAAAASSKSSAVSVSSASSAN
jgi:cytoskeletal protein CcmA (bactofilin family)